MSKDGLCPRSRVPRLLLCVKKYAIHEIGGDPQALILGKINHIWVDEQLVSRNTDRVTIDPAKMNPLARLGGNHYSLLGELLIIQRPDKP